MVSACASDGALQFTLLTATNTPKRDWDVTYNLTAVGLMEDAGRRVKGGLQPASVTAYPWAGAVRYCAVWVKEAPKEKVPPKKP